MGVCDLSLNLAKVFHATGRPAEAVPLFTLAVEIYRTALEEQHADYARPLTDLASLYDAMGRHAEAESLRQEGLGT